MDSNSDSMDLSQFDFETPQRTQGRDADLISTVSDQRSIDDLSQFDFGTPNPLKLELTSLKQELGLDQTMETKLEEVLELAYRRLVWEEACAGRWTSHGYSSSPPYPFQSGFPLCLSSPSQINFASRQTQANTGRRPSRAKDPLSGLLGQLESTMAAMEHEAGQV